MNRIPIIVWILLVSGIIIGAGVWFFSRNPAVLGEQADEGRPVEVSRPVEGTVDYDIVGREHIASGTVGTGYNSDPPSSGPHWAGPAKNGVSNDSIPDQQAIHNMEHGHVWITYKPDIGDEIKNKLAEIVSEDDWKVIMSPREKNETQIVLVAWGRVLKMDEVDYSKIEDFIRTYRNRGPEKTPE